MKTWIAAVLIGLILSLTGFIWQGTCDDIKKLEAEKADNKTITIILQQVKEQQKENQQDLKEQRKEQQRTNEQLYKSIQGILIQIAKEK